MIHSVVINLGYGDLYEGYPVVTAGLWALNNPRPQQFIGSLPPAPNLVELYRNWQSIYQRLVRSLALSQDGKILASGSRDRTIRLWNVESGQCLQILAGHTSGVQCVAFSHDGNTLASGSNDKTIRLSKKWVENPVLLGRLFLVLDIFFKNLNWRSTHRRGKIARTPKSIFTVWLCESSFAIHSARYTFKRIYYLRN